jgi:hypothetical protein
MGSEINVVGQPALDTLLLNGLFEQMRPQPNSPRTRPAASSPLLQGLRPDPGRSRPLHALAEQTRRTLLASPTQPPGILRTTVARLVSEVRLNRKAGVGTRVVDPRVHSGVGAWQGCDPKNGTGLPPWDEATAHLNFTRDNPVYSEPADEVHAACSSKTGCVHAVHSGGTSRSKST